MTQTSYDLIEKTLDCVVVEEKEKQEDKKHITIKVTNY